LKFLTITDEFTRKSLAVVTATSIRAERVRQELDRLFIRHGVPECIRSDNGPEFVARPVQKWLRSGSGVAQEWLRQKGVALLYITLHHAGLPLTSCQAAPGRTRMPRAFIAGFEPSV